MKTLSARFLPLLLATVGLGLNAVAQETTPPPLPVVTTTMPTNVVPNIDTLLAIATLTGSISGVTAETPVYFTYGNATASTVVSAGTVTADGTFSANIEGLTASRQYYVRAWAQVGQSVITGFQLEFRTDFPGTGGGGSGTTSPSTVWADIDPPKMKIYDDHIVFAIRLRHLSEPVNYGLFFSSSSHTLMTDPPVISSDTASADGTYYITVSGLTKGAEYWFQASAFFGGNHTGVGGVVMPIIAKELIDSFPETDQFEVLAGQPRVLDVLPNDRDYTGTAVTIVSVTAPKHGTATITADQKILYTPGNDFHVELVPPYPIAPRDQFVYTVRNERGGEGGALVEIRDAAYSSGATTSSQGLLSANAQQRAGSLKVTLTGRGHFTASYQEHGATLPISAAFTYNGSAGAYTKQVNSGPLKGLTVALNHNLESGLVTATADDGTGAVAVDLRKVKRYTAKSPYPGTGRYAVKLVADTSASLAMAESNATVIVNKTGSASVVGKLNDGRPFSTSANVARFDGDATGLAFYSSAYHTSAGYVSGPLLFSSSPGNVQGTLDWQKPAKMTAPMNKLPGFQTTVTATGSR